MKQNRKFETNPVHILGVVAFGGINLVVRWFFMLNWYVTAPGIIVALFALGWLVYDFAHYIKPELSRFLLVLGVAGCVWCLIDIGSVAIASQPKTIDSVGVNAVWEK